MKRHVLSGMVVLKIVISRLKMYALEVLSRYLTNPSGSGKSTSTSRKAHQWIRLTSLKFINCGPLSSGKSQKCELVFSLWRLSSSFSPQSLWVLAKHFVTVLPHPPYSPDLAPCDYFLFPKLKKPLTFEIRFQMSPEIEANETHELKGTENKMETSLV